jgi:hypothetical protein
VEPYDRPIETTDAECGSPAEKGIPMRWQIPITIVELGRCVYVEAPTRREAIAEFRSGVWEECSDAKDHIVTKVGKCEEVK